MSVSPVSTRVMNLARFLTNQAERQPEATGFVWGAREWSWAELEARVAALTAALIEDYGLRPGERVLVQSANCNQLFETMFACFRAGAVWVPANFRLSAEDVAGLAQSSGARGLICGAGFAGHADACARVLPADGFTVAIGAADFGPDIEDLIARHRGAAAPHARVERDDPAWFFFTSGTTGRPKAAVLTHGQLAFVMNNHLCDLMPGTGPDDASIVVAPLSHGAGIHQLAQTAAGAKTILPAGEKFDPEAVWEMVERWRVTNAFTVPTILKMLVEHPAARARDHSSLRYVIYAGGPMYRADQITALDVLGPKIVQYFGLGEVTGNITVLPPAHHSRDDAQMRIGTCGFARTGMEVQIQDDDGRELARGETGEICVIGPAVFAGYHDNPEANAKSFRDGWFRTGDLGHMDAAGFVYITGRASDMFISGGSNIHPREIEEKALEHPDISEVAVVGVPDPVWGEVGVAVCVARAGAEPAAIDLEGWLAQRMARYKLPRAVHYWEALPKSAYGKTPKPMIREELARRGQMPG